MKIWLEPRGIAGGGGELVSSKAVMISTSTYKTSRLIPGIYKPQAASRKKREAVSPQSVLDLRSLACCNGEVVAAPALWKRPL